MNLKKRIISFILTLLLCISMLGDISSPVFAKTLESKITKELQIYLDKIDDNDIVPVYVWMDDIDYEKVKNQTLQKTSFTEENLLQRSDKIFKPLYEGSILNFVEENLAEENLAKLVVEQTEDENDTNYEYNLESFEKAKEFYEINKEALLKLSKDVDTYSEIKRSFAREAYNIKNGQFVEENLKGAEIFFQSQYAPMIICEITKKKVIELSNLENVTSLSLYQEVETTDDGNLNISLPSIDAVYTRDTLGFNGLGVRVGQIESGRPETGISDLSNTSITRGGTNNNTAHASLVAAIIAGSKGLAPQASLYCTTVDNFYANAEWLVSSNVTVINRSNSASSDGTYDDVAKWVDHIVNQHNVSWVQTPGNTGPNEYVCSPGNAYNVITVGAIDDKGTVGTSDDTYFTSTNYKTGSGMPNKPDVVAPGVGFSVTGGTTMSGTSFAAPHVTGMIAQMMSFSPTLKLRPDAIKAAVMASCNRKTTGESLNSLTTKEGAGVINAINAANSISNVSTQQTYYTTTANSISFDFYPLTTGRKTIAISWLRRNTGTGTNHSTITSPALTDFDLYIYDSSGNLVASSASSSNNAEFIGFNATTTSKYTVKIIRYTNNTTSERISLAHVR